MSKIKIWGRDVNVKFIYECKINEKPLKSQKDALILFKEKIVNNDVITTPDQVVAFCEKSNKDELNGKKIDNIFKYVMPKEVVIDRNSNERILSLICNYKFDLDSCLIIKFINEQLIDIYVEEEE